MKRTFLGLSPLTLALTTLGLGGLACGDDDPGTEGAETGETGDGDGDGDGAEVGDGDGDGDTGDGDTGDGDGDEPPPPVDTDMDGIEDGTDNCPDMSNPNQLDFDANGIGNVCDTQVFTGVSGMLNSTASADAGALGGCDIPILLDVTGGEIWIQLDDDATIAGFEIVEFQVADILDKECPLALNQTANVSIKDFLISNDGGPYPVSVPHSQAAHDAGSIAGDSDMPHPVLSTATLEAALGGDPPMPSALDLPGALPIFTANVANAGANGSLAWADAQFVLATDVFMVDTPIGLTDVNFELRGLVGSLVLTP